LSDKKSKEVFDKPRDAGPKGFVKGLDFYVEDGKYVFTEYYLKNRGYCCQNGCRHCPYGFKNENHVTS